MIQNLKQYFTLALVIVLGFFLFRTCERHKQTINDLLELNELANDQNLVIIDAEKNISAARVAMVEKNNKINQLLDTIEYLKQPTIITKVVLETKIDTVKIPFETFVEQEIDGEMYLKTPQSFLKADKWYTISGSVKSLGIFFDSLTYINDFYIATGTEDHGSFLKNLFRRNEMIVTIKDNNPYSKTKLLQQTVVNDSKDRWHIGPHAGFMLSEKKLVPTVGIGITYSLISF